MSDSEQLAALIHASPMAQCTTEGDEQARRDGSKPWCERFAATITTTSGPSHPHDGYAYEGCRCVCCTNVRALAAARVSGDREDGLRTALDGLVRAVGDYKWVLNGRDQAGTCTLGCRATQGEFHTEDCVAGVLSLAYSAGLTALASPAPAMAVASCR